MKNELCCLELGLSPVHLQLDLPPLSGPPRLVDPLRTLGSTLQQCDVKSGTCRHPAVLSSPQRKVLGKREAAPASALSPPSTIKLMEAPARE